MNAITVNESKKVREKKKDAALDEVVFLPGTVLEVQNDPRPDPAFDNIPKVELKETKGGGVSDPNQRIEYSQTDSTSVTGPKLDEDEKDDTEARGLTYAALTELNIGEVAGHFDSKIPEDEKFQVMDPNWEDNYTDPSTDWVEIQYAGRTYFIIVYDVLMNATEVHEQKAPENPPKPPPAPLQLRIGPDEYSMGFPLEYRDRDEIDSHRPYDLAPGWSIVELEDEGELVPYYALTDEVIAFLSHGEVDEEDVKEVEGKDKDEGPVGLDPEDYPAGQHEVTIAMPVNLPASTTEGGEYTTNVELFNGDKIPVFVEDNLTKQYGRCRIEFFSRTFFVPLNMLVSPTERKDKLEVVDVDEDEFVPESEGAKLQVIEGVMDLDPDNEKTIVERAHPFFVPLSERNDIMEYEERGSWIALIWGSKFIYAKISDWEAFRDA